MKFNSCILLSLFFSGASAFSISTPSSSVARAEQKIISTQLFQSTEINTETDVSTPENEESSPNFTIRVPVTFDSMVKDAATAMRDAKSAGVNRQTIRVLLPRDPKSADLGQYFEDEVEDMDTRELLLAPPDESWQGGIMQLYRAAAPTARKVLRVFAGDVGGVPPKVIEDRSVDDSGVDGVGLWMTQSNDPKDDISCFVQPLQETVNSIVSISEQAGSRLVVLMNPQWRNVDDALDSASKEDGFFGSVATFLGGKGNSMKQLNDAGFENVYSIEGYVCKGGNVRLMKRFDSDWVVFAENDSETDFIRLGHMKVRPTYQDVDQMLNDKGVSLKYARDIGLAPKLE